MRVSFTTSKSWLIAVAMSGALCGLFFFAIAMTLWKGVGLWGNNMPVAWAFAIVNFVWWIGIAHAGTFISAILLLAEQHWRSSVSRLAETMTIVAVACAGIFPLLHLGRPWFFYWLFPYYDAMDLWPQFRSPLVWDVFAVLTYLTISLLYWYMGLVPDLACYRDQSENTWVKRLYAIFALGWNGSRKQWRVHKSCSLLLAGFATPLVIAVHSIVGMDFAVSIVPGWHSTIFPPYFVAGAVFSGFAMVLTLAIPIRKIFGIEDIITPRHLDYCAKFALAMSVIVSYGYLMEAFTALNSQDAVEIYMLKNRFAGPYAFVSWTMILCNVLLPQLLWFRSFRANLLLVFILSLFINLGMWCERFVIIVTSLQRDFMPSSWHVFVPTARDWMILFGSMGFFAFLFLLGARVLPLLALSEVRGLKLEKPETFR